jgi:2Fe-2S ferredoxin
VKPTDINFLANPNEKLMLAAERNGLRWPTVCGGLAECGVCYLEVLNDPKLSPPNNLELGVLERMLARPCNGGTMRLACQLGVDQNLEVFRIGIRNDKN